MGFEGMQNLLLGVGIHRRERIIEHQNGRIQQQGAGNGQPLFLTAGEGHPFLPHLGLIALGETHNIIVDTGNARHPFDLLAARIGFAQGNIGGDGGGKQEWLLRHIGKLAAQCGERQLVNRNATHDNRTVSRIGKAHQQLEQGALACPGAPHHPEHPPLLEGNVDICKQGALLKLIAHPFDLQRKGRDKRGRLGGLFDIAAFPQQAFDTGVGGAAPLDDVEQPGDGKHRPDQLAEVHGEAGELTQGQLIAQHQHTAPRHREEVGATDTEIDDRIELGIDAGHRHIALPRLFGQLGKALIFQRFNRIGFQHPHAGKGLLGLVVELGEGPLRRLELGVDLSAEAIHEIGHHRQRQQGDQRQLPGVLAAHDGEHQYPDHDGVHQSQHPFASGHLHSLNVIGGMGHQIASTVALIKIGAHPGEMAEKAIAQHIGQTVRGTKQHHPPDVAQQINQHTQTKQPRQIAHQGTIVETAPGDAINHPAHHFGRNNGQQGHHQQQGDGSQITGPLLLEKPAQS